jgi:hypothetical protein
MLILGGERCGRWCYIRNAVPEGTCIEACLVPSFAICPTKYGFLSKCSILASGAQSRKPEFGYIERFIMGVKMHAIISFIEAL